MPPPRPPRRELDEATITAVGILNEAVKDVRVPGGMEFRVITGALERVVASRRAGDLAIAEAAFDRLDGGVRAGIAERALDRAEDHRRAMARDADRAPAPVANAPAGDGEMGPSKRDAGMRAPTRPPQPAGRRERPAATGMPLIDAMAGALRRRP